MQKVKFRHKSSILWFISTGFFRENRIEPTYQKVTANFNWEQWGKNLAIKRLKATINKNEICFNIGSGFPKCNTSTFTLSRACKTCHRNKKPTFPIKINKKSHKQHLKMCSPQLSKEWRKKACTWFSNLTREGACYEVLAWPAMGSLIWSNSSSIHPMKSNKKEILAISKSARNLASTTEGKLAQFKNRYLLLSQKTTKMMRSMLTSLAYLSLRTARTSL